VAKFNKLPTRKYTGIVTSRDDTDSSAELDTVADGDYACVQDGDAGVEQSVSVGLSR
jgi:hypothetical protein